MAEFQEALKKMTSGDISLVNELGSVRLAMQAAVSKAFQTPEVIRLFAKAQPKQLRINMEELHQKHKLGKVPKEIYVRQTIEILTALQKLGDELSISEKAFLNENMTEGMQIGDIYNIC